MAQGPYDHPSYLTRQKLSLGASTAGANGLSGGASWPWDMRLRVPYATVRVPGTSSTTGHQVIILAVGTTITAGGTSTVTSTGTTTLQAIALNTLAAYTNGTGSDLNTTLKAGGTLVMKNGTDATGTYDAYIEGYLDPSATWTGSN
jgi:hypothetical protein